MLRVYDGFCGLSVLTYARRTTFVPTLTYRVSRMHIGKKEKCWRISPCASMTSSSGMSGPMVSKWPPDTVRIKVRCSEIVKFVVTPEQKLSMKPCATATRLVRVGNSLSMAFAASVSDCLMMQFVWPSSMRNSIPFSKTGGRYKVVPGVFSLSTVTLPFS